jgi:solute carrier family 35 protein F1/2
MSLSPPSALATPLLADSPRSGVYGLINRARAYQKRYSFKSVLIGQVLSILVTCTSIFTQALTTRNANIPTLQNWLNYVALSALFVLNYRRKTQAPTEERSACLSVPWYYYFAISLMDTQGNNLFTASYNYGATITSAMLIDALVIPNVMLLSYCFLRTRYLATNFIGVTVCLVGLAFLVFADLHEVHGSSTLKGDLVAVLGTVFYSFSNIGQEVMVKGGNTLEYLGMIGIFGSIIGGIQLFCFQYEELLLVSSESVVSATNSALVVIQFSRSLES